MKIKDSVILVTGGAGFVGSHIIDKLLLENPKKIIIIDDFSRGTPKNLEDALKSKKIKTVAGDIRNVSSINKLTKGVDYIFHQAAIRITKCAEDPRLCKEVLIDGTFNILEAAVKNKIRKLIFASSVSVYGEPSYLPMDEKHPFNNTTAYGAGKIAGEEMIKAFRAMYGLNYVVLRYFNVYGPRVDIYGAYTEVLIKWLEKIDKNEPPILHGDGRQALDFVFVEDIARANILALKSDINEGVFNIGTGKSTSLRELLRAIIKLTGSGLEPIFDSKTKRPYVQRRQADVKAAKKELGFVAETDLKSGLRKLIEWRKEQLKKGALNR